jgi:ElaB/YqjD/DUF883 family membrane-anchored ribosome-binding protein
MADTTAPTPKVPRKKAAAATAPKPRGRPPKASASASPKAEKTAPVKRKAPAATAKASEWRDQADQIKGQAAQTARAAADTAKDRAGSAMHGLARLISDTAGTVDAKLGPQYGDYARYAAEAVAGAAKSLDAKDINQLASEARDFVRKSPAVAIGAAAVVGFVLMRLAKGSGPSES